MKTKPSLRSFLALAGSALLLATQAQAATYYWDSNSTTAGFASTSGTWGTSTFWGTSSLGTSATANTTILASDDINFGTAANAYTGTVTVGGGGKTFYSMTLGGTGAVNFISDLTARTLTIGNGGITMASGAGAVTLGDGVTAGNNVLISLAAGAQTWTNASTNHLTINNTAVSTFTRATGATLTFNKTSTGNFVMSTTHLTNDATGIVGPWAFFGTGTSQRYAFNNLGTIDAYTGGTAAAGAEDLTSDTTNYDFDGSGTNTLTASRTAHTIRYTGTGHTIDLGASGANTLTANGLLAVGASGTLTLQRTGGSGTLDIGASNELVIGGSQNVSISAPISGVGKLLTYAGTGTLTLSGTNTYTGTTTAGSGTMVIDGTSVIPTAGLVNVGAIPGTTLQLNHSITVGNLAGGGTTTAGGGMVNLQGNTLTLGDATSTTYGGGFTGTSGSGLIKQGAGALTLSTATNMAVPLTINAGTVLVSQGNLSGSAITLGANNATLQFGSNGSAGVNGLGGAVISNNIVIGSSVTSTGAKLWVNGNQGAWKFTGAITGAGSGAQTLLFDNRANAATGGDRNTTTFSGVISDGTNGGNLGLSFLINPQTANNTHPSYVNLTAANTFTGNLTASRTVGGSTSWLTIGGELWSDGPNNTPTYGREGTGYLGANNSGNYAGNILFGNANTLNLAYFSSANQTLSGVIGGASANNGALFKQGSGTLTLTNANTYTGATTVSMGTLDLGGGTANGSLASPTLNLNGGTLSYTRTGNTTQGFTTTNLTAPTLFSGSASALSVVSGNTLNLGTIVSAGGTITFGSTGAGTVAALAASNVGGIIPGTTFNDTDWAVANGADSAITAYAGSYTLTNPTTGAGDTASNYAGNNISVDSTQSPDAAITPNSLRFNTAGAYTLNLFAGSTNTINSGGIIVNSTVGDNASVITGGTALRGSSNGSLLVVQNNTNANGALTIGSILANNGTSGLVKTGAGTLILAGANTYTGTTAINAGTLVLINTNTSLTTVITAGTLQLGNGGSTGALSTAAGSTVFNNSSLVVNRTGSVTLPLITGTGSVSYTGVANTNVLTLNNTIGNNYSGGFTLNSGQVGSLPASGTYYGFGTGTLTINGGSIRGVNTTSTVIIPNDVAWNANVGFGRASGGNPIFTFNGNIMLGASVAASTWSGAEPYSLTFNGNIGQSSTGFGLNLNASSTGSVWTFNGQNTFTGALNGNTKALVIGGSGYLGGGNYGGAITSGAFTYRSSADQTLSGNISAASLTKDTSGTSTLILSGTNTNSGTTTVSAGTLQFAKTASLYTGETANWTAAKINVKSGATLALNVDSAGSAGFTAANLNTLLGNISVANTAVEGLQAGAKLGFDTSTADGGTFTQGNAIADSTGSGGFDGAIGLTKLGAGTLVLDQANTYTGTTTVSGGTLLINGSTPAAGLVTVSSTATLGGSTALGQMGDVHMSAGGSLRPGDTDRIDNWMQVEDLTLAATTQLYFELGTPDDGGPSLTANDLVLAANIPVLAGVINVTPLLPEFAAAPGGSKWRLFSLTSGTVPASHTLSLEPALATSYNIEAVPGADSVYLVSAVPEAGTAGLLALGLLLLRRLRRGRAA